MNELTDLETALVRAVRSIRAHLAEKEVSYMRLDIEVTGRTHDGDVRIEFRLGEEYSSNSPVGGSLSAVVEEFLRRKGWSAKHAPLCLPAASDGRGE